MCCALARCAENEKEKLKACSACNQVVYCCKEHQTEHYKEGGHKLVCAGRKDKALSFQDCLERAQRSHNEKMWMSALMFYGGMLELTERAVGLFHPQVAKILDAMATCYKMKGKYEEAGQCLQRVLVIRELMNQQGTAEGNRAVFNTMGQVAEMYMAAGNVPLAKELLLKTKESAVEVFGENSFEHGRVLCALGGCLDRNDETSEAIQMLQRATAIPAYVDASEPSNMLAASNAFFNLGLLQRKAGDEVEASKLLKRALEMKIKAGLPADHPDMLEGKAALVNA